MKDNAINIVMWLISFTWKKMAYKLILLATMGLGLVISFTGVDGTKYEISILNEIPNWLSFALIAISLMLILFEAVKDLKKKALIFTHLGITKSINFDIASARPFWDRLHIPDDNEINISRYVVNDSIVSPEEALKKTLHIIEVLESKTKNKPEDIKLYYGGVVQVPLAFTAGTILDNTMFVDIYDWKRNGEKQGAYRLIKGKKDTSDLVQISEPEVHDLSSELAIEIALSYPINHQNTVDAVGEIPTLKITANSVGRDQFSSLSTQNEVCEKFHDIIDRYSQTNIKKIHVFIAAQNSMVFQLGRQLSRRVHKEVIVWQFEIQNEHQNPWGISISNKGYKIVKNRHLEQDINHDRILRQTS